MTKAEVSGAGRLVLGGEEKIRSLKNGGKLLGAGLRGSGGLARGDHGLGEIILQEVPFEMRISG